MGSGAIQAGWFLNEAYQSKNFKRLLAGEVVAAIRQNGGCYTYIIGHTAGKETVKIGLVQIDDPSQPEDKARRVNSIG